MDKRFTKNTVKWALAEAKAEFWKSTSTVISKAVNWAQKRWNKADKRAQELFTEHVYKS